MLTSCLCFPHTVSRYTVNLNEWNDAVESQSCLCLRLCSKRFYIVGQSHGEGTVPPSYQSIPAPCTRASATMITELCTKQNEKAAFNCDVWEFDMIFDWAIL